jgi:hypothetical protein
LRTAAYALQMFDLIEVGKLRGDLMAARTHELLDLALVSSRNVSHWLVVVAIILVASPSFAAFVVLDGNNPEPDEENVLLQNDDVGTTISGNTNQSNATVTFTSASQFLAAPSGGQARVEGRSADDINSSQVAIDDSITVELANPGFSFRDLIFNAAIVGGLGADGFLTIDVMGTNADGTPASATITMDENGDPLEIMNGSNFYTVLATDGMLMNSVEIGLVSGEYADLRQIRISGVIPEPSTVALAILACLGMVGLVYRRK